MGTLVVLRGITCRRDAITIFFKNKPTRIGMQFLFYESLYTVGIIANFNKNITESLLFNAFDMKAICEMGFKLW